MRRRGPQLRRPSVLHLAAADSAAQPFATVAVAAASEPFAAAISLAAAAPVRGPRSMYLPV